MSGPPAWGFGGLLTTPYRKIQLVTKCYAESRKLTFIFMGVKLGLLTKGRT
jgi:hypothetical protein